MKYALAGCVVSAFLALGPARAAVDEGRYQIVFGPPLYVLDTATGAIWSSVPRPDGSEVMVPHPFARETPPDRLPKGWPLR